MFVVYICVCCVHLRLSCTFPCVCRIRFQAPKSQVGVTSAGDASTNMLLASHFQAAKSMKMMLACGKQHADALNLQGKESTCVHVNEKVHVREKDMPSVAYLNSVS